MRACAPHGWKKCQALASWCAYMAQGTCLPFLTLLTTDSSVPPKQVRFAGPWSLDWSSSSASF